MTNQRGPQPKKLVETKIAREIAGADSGITLVLRNEPKHLKQNGTEARTTAEGEQVCGFLQLRPVLNGTH